MGHNDDQVAHWFCDEWKALGSAKVKPTRRWQLIGFRGPAGRESTGIVDLLAIRKNGGGAKRPDKSEIKRLRDVAKHYNARDVVLAEWVKGNQLKFSWLVFGILDHVFTERARESPRLWIFCPACKRFFGDLVGRPGRMMS